MLNKKPISFEWRNHAKHNNRLKEFISVFDSKHYILLVSGSLGDVVPNLMFIFDIAVRSSSNFQIILDEGYSAFASRIVRKNLACAFVDIPTRISLHNALSQFHPLLFEPGYIYPTLITLHPLIPEALTSGRLTDFDAKRLILGLPPRQPLNYLEDENSRERILKFFTDSGLVRGRTVLIAPLGLTNPPIPLDIIIKLVSSLERSGIKAVLNLSGLPSAEYEEYTTGVLASVPRLDTPPELVLEALKVCGMYFGGPTGLTAIALTSGYAPLVVIYRNRHMAKLSNEGNDLLLPIKTVLKDDVSKSVELLEIIHEKEDSDAVQLTEITAKFFLDPNSILDRYIMVGSQN